MAALGGYINMLYTIWLLALGAALAGSPPAPPHTIFQGHFAHAPAGDSVRLTVGFRQVSAPLSPGGDFRFDLTGLAANTPTKFAYKEQQTQLRLSPGDQLVMQLDFTDFDKSLTYSGRGSLVNNYVARSLYEFSYGPPSALLRPGDFPAMTDTPAQAQAAATALRQARRAYLAAYCRAHPLPAAFVHEEQVSIDATWAIQQVAYAYQHDLDAMPAGYFDFLKEVPVQELERLSFRSLLDNSLLVNFAMGYGGRLVPTHHFGPDPAEGPRVYELATAELGTGKLRDLALRLLVSSNLYGNLPGLRAFYPAFRRYNADSALAASVRHSLSVTGQALVQPGQPAPAFTLRDEAGRMVSLADFKGQVVYLDFWGTWCPPCMSQMKEFAPALKKQFAGRDVVFLYISVGDPEAKWRQTIAEQHFASANSVHLRAPDGEVAANYQVNGYPSYYLIGRDGRLVQPYAPRPSDGVKTIAAIEAALAQ